MGNILSGIDTWLQSNVGNVSNLVNQINTIPGQVTQYGQQLGNQLYGFEQQATTGINKHPIQNFYASQTGSNIGTWISKNMDIVIIGAVILGYLALRKK